MINFILFWFISQIKSLKILNLTEKPYNSTSCLINTRRPFTENPVQRNSALGTRTLRSFLNPVLLGEGLYPIVVLHLHGIQ